MDLILVTGSGIGWGCCTVSELVVADTGVGAVQVPQLRAAHLLIQALLWTLDFLYKVNFGDFILVLKLKERIPAGEGCSWLFHALQKML